jgi:hypothetical protein
MDFRRDQLHPEGHGSAAAQLGLEVEGKESVKKVVGQKSQQQKTLDRLGLMAVDMIRMPAVHQFIESVVFNIPAQVC